MLVYVKLTTQNSYIPVIIGWLIVIEGLSNILMAVLPQFNLPLSHLLINYLNYVSFLELQQVTNVLAIFMGIGFIILGRGLAKKQRFSWHVTIGFLLFSIANSIFPSMFVPTLVYSIVMLFLLLIFRKSFYVKSHVAFATQQWVALISVIFVLAYGTIGSYLLRDQYHNLHDWVDAIYYSLETYTTIGYGDIIPLTENAKIFTCSMIILGVSTFVAATGIVLGPIFETRLRGVFNMVNRLNNIKSHIIIFGANAMSLHTAKLLQAKGDIVVFLSDDSQTLSDAERQGFRIVLGAASKEEILDKAQLTSANAIICASSSDADNLLVVMAAQAIRTKNKAKFRIITRIDEPEHMPFAKTVGADEIISPAMLMGDSISRDLQ